MTVLSPCRRCARKGDCERLADLRKSLRGSGITKANVKCGIPKADFPVGQPVVVRCFTLGEARYFNPDYPETQKVAVSRHGVVKGHRAGKFHVLLNVGEEVGGSDHPLAIIGVFHDQLSRIEERESPVELCACGLTEERCGALAHRPHLRSGPWQCWSERIV